MENITHPRWQSWRHPEKTSRRRRPGDGPGARTFAGNSTCPVLVAAAEEVEGLAWEIDLNMAVRLRPPRPQQLQALRRRRGFPPRPQFPHPLHPLLPQHLLPLPPPPPPLPPLRPRPHPGTAPTTAPRLPPMETCGRDRATASNLARPWSVRPGFRIHCSCATADRDAWEARLSG